MNKIALELEETANGRFIVHAVQPNSMKGQWA